MRSLLRNSKFYRKFIFLSELEMENFFCFMSFLMKVKRKLEKNILIYSTKFK